MSDTEEAMSMLDNIEEHAEFQHHEIARLTRERDEAREWLQESRDNAQRLLEAADGWKLAAEEARAEVERLREAVDGVFVPKEPTEEMWLAFVSCNSEPLGYRERFRWEGDYGNFVASYWEMLKAARRAG